MCVKEDKSLCKGHMLTCKTVYHSDISHELLCQSKKSGLNQLRIKHFEVTKEYEQRLIMKTH